ncbi:MAG TPA: hypothetical protein VG944_22925 [Fimbriimonas sp.]|nr:hypothetical protein [Fimbriimonas sp.]
MNQLPPIADLPEELHPCKHMETLVSRRSDGTLAGPAKWYTDFHILTCVNCRTALKGLRALHQEIRDLKQSAKEGLRLSKEEWDLIEAGWDRSDKPGQSAGR